MTMQAVRRARAPRPASAGAAAARATSRTRARSPRTSAFPHYVIDETAASARARHRRLRRRAPRRAHAEPVRALQPAHQVHAAAAPSPRDRRRRARHRPLRAPRARAGRGAAPTLARRASIATRISRTSCSRAPRGARPGCVSRSATHQGRGARASRAALGLPNADKPESQEICFVPDGDHAAFVEARGGAGPRRRDRRRATGAALGAHDGAHRFTVGQRRGVPARRGEPRFVVRIDAATGEVLVGPARALARVGAARRRRALAARPVDPAPGRSAARSRSATTRRRSPAGSSPAGDGARRRVASTSPRSASRPGRPPSSSDGEACWAAAGSNGGLLGASFACCLARWRPGSRRQCYLGVVLQDRARRTAVDRLLAALRGRGRCHGRCHK